MNKKSSNQIFCPKAKHTEHWTCLYINILYRYLFYKRNTDMLYCSYVVLWLLVCFTEWKLLLLRGKGKICSHTCIPTAKYYCTFYEMWERVHCTLSKCTKHSGRVLMMMRMFRVVGSLTQVVPRFVAVKVRLTGTVGWCYFSSDIMLSVVCVSLFLLLLFL